MPEAGQTAQKPPDRPLLFADGQASACCRLFGLDSRFQNVGIEND
jgi:hypothetical protein